MCRGMPDDWEPEGSRWKRVDRTLYDALPGILLVIAGLFTLLGVILLIAGESQGVTALSGPLLFGGLALALRSKQRGWWRR